VSGSACHFSPYSPEALRTAAIDQRESLAAGGHFVDLGERICPFTPCAPTEGNIVKYYDSNHLTATYAQLLLPDLADALQPIMTGRGRSALVPVVDQSIHKSNEALGSGSR
jgi:hypothetical protein